MDVNGFHITLSGIVTVVTILSSAGAIYRFMVKPALDSARTAQQRTDRFRRHLAARVALLETFVPDEHKGTVSELRAKLLEEDCQ